MKRDLFEKKKPIVQAHPQALNTLPRRKEKEGPIRLILEREKRGSNFNNSGEKTTRLGT